MVVTLQLYIQIQIHIMLHYCVQLVVQWTIARHSATKVTMYGDCTMSTISVNNNIIENNPMLV